MIAILGALGVSSYNGTWTKLGEGPFSKREGLMAVSSNGTMFLSGGRDADGLGFAADVYSSASGESWARTTPKSVAPFGARAYHNMVELNGCLYVFGGQTFKGYFNDVHRSCDGAGAVWDQVSANASWPVRAGAAAWTTSAGEIVLAGGCFSNSKGKRDFRADVWATKDGETWVQRTAAAEWSARSGPRLVEFKGELFIVAGERGFTAGVQLADVWKSADGGATWSLVAAKPGFSARSGHGVVVSPDGTQMAVIAGWPELHDVWTTSDGVTWEQTADAVWNCGAKSCGKFDFWSLFHAGELFTVGGSGASATFGKLYDDTWKLSTAATAQWP